MTARVPALSLLVPVAGLLAACSADPPSTTTVASTTFATVAPRVTLSFTRIEPERLALSGDRVAAQTVEVAYTIPDPQTVSEATLALYVRGIGDIAKMDVPVAATGTARLAIDPPEHSLGAVVKFRASCPAGVTDWYTLGQIPLSFEEARRDVFRISQVTPQWVPVSPPPDPTGTSTSAEVVEISGPRLTRDCQIEAQANGSAIELRNVNFLGNRFQGLLYFRDIGSQRVLHRFAELKLSVNRKGWFGAIERVPFAEE